MKQRPIIFNTEMVKAIINGNKLQTRRPFPIWQRPFKTDSGYGAVAQRHQRYGFGFFEDSELAVMNCFTQDLCPIAKTGDQLWVRETFQLGLCTKSTIAYRATHNPSDLEEGHFETIKWRPSIHMPRWVSRILLEVTDVRVEQLNALRKSPADIKAEGFKSFPQFKHVWQSIYGECLPTDWVWVVEFKVISTTGSEI